MLLRKYEYLMDKNMLWFTLNHWNVKIESKMIHSESESDFNFAINLASDFNSVSNSASDSDYESDFSAAFMNVDICISFIFYICIPLNKPADAFFFIYSHDRVNSYASNGSKMHIFFWRIITQIVWFYHAIKFS